MNWKTAYRSFYYERAPEPADLSLDPAATVMLSIDVQNIYLQVSDDPVEAERWEPFRQRMRGTVIPATRALQDAFRAAGMDVIHARIACLLEDGRDRSLSQKKPGWNYLLLPRESEASRIVPELAPRTGAIVVTKTTDSALTGTGKRSSIALDSQESPPSGSPHFEARRYRGLPFSPVHGRCGYFLRRGTMKRLATVLPFVLAALVLCGCATAPNPADTATWESDKALLEANRRRLALEEQQSLDGYLETQRDFSRTSLVAGYRETLRSKLAAAPGGPYPPESCTLVPAGIRCLPRQ